MKRTKVEKINKLMKTLVAMRKKLLDEIMVEEAKYPIGTELYNFRTGAYIGKVSKYYRIHAGHFEFDTDNYTHYEIHEDRDDYCQSYTNSSGPLAYTEFGTKEEYNAYLERRKIS